MKIENLLKIKQDKRVLEEIGEEVFNHYGLRVTGKDNDDYNASIGDILEPSHVWIDGDWTEDILDGTSAIDWNYKFKSVPKYLSYYGDRVFLLGSNQVQGGEDIGETIMTDAVVLMILEVRDEL